MTPVVIWARLLSTTALAALLAIALSPPRPRLHVPDALAVPIGVAAGAVLFTAASRRPPVLRLSRTGPSTVVRHALLGLSAATEELLWRRALLGELLPLGPLAALAVSTAGFAAVHRRGRLVHVGTGAVFGGVYLVTGLLVAAIAAHWAYNAFVGDLVQSEPP